MGSTLKLYRFEIGTFLAALCFVIFSPAVFAQEENMISLNPNTGNITVDKLSRLAAGIQDPEMRKAFLLKPQNQLEIETELKNSLGRVERDLKFINDCNLRGQTGMAATEMTRLEGNIQSYQTAQKFAQKFGKLELKFKTALKLVTLSGPSGKTTEVQVDYGAGEKSTRMTLTKPTLEAIAGRGLLNPVSNPGSTQEMQTFKPVADAIRVPRGSVATEMPSARPQLCSDCTTGGLMVEVIK